MLDGLINIGIDAISQLLSNIWEQASFFTGIRWVDLYGWLQLPNDIAAAIGALFGLFAVFALVGLVKKLVVIFG